MIRPVRLALVSCSLSLALAGLGCASNPQPKTPQERVVAAEEKLQQMEQYSKGESTYAEYRETLQELNDAKKDLEEERSNVATEQPANPYQPGYPYPYQTNY